MMPKETRDEAVIKKIKDTLKHFPNKISKKINDYVINDVLLESRYIFTARKGTKQFGYCTHCKSEYETYKLKHKTKMGCPECRSICEVRAAGYSRKYMIDKAYFVYYEKSKINKEAVIARGFTVWMDYSGDYKNVKPKYGTDARYLFEMRNPVFIKTLYSWPDNAVNYELRKSVFTLFQKTGYFGVPLDLNQKVSTDSIREAITDTQFQYSEWDKFEQHELDDYVEYFSLYAKHPQVEYLMKLGLKGFVERKLNNTTTHRTINWNGKTIDKVLKVDRANVKEIIRNSHKITPFALAIYQLSRKDHSNITVDEAVDIEEQGLEYEFERLKAVLKNTRFRTLINYLNKQMRRSEETENEETDPGNLLGERRSLRSVFVMLNDYWDGCKELNIRVGKDIAEYPSNLQAAHDNIYKQIKFKKDEMLDKKIKERIKELSIFEYENELFFIRPFDSTDEIIKEGKELKHCVGNYSERYANGTTAIFAIRRKEKPDEPYYTLELEGGRIRQYYGYGNNRKVEKPKEIIAFVKEFEEKVLINKKEIAP